MIDLSIIGRDAYMKSGEYLGVVGKVILNRQDPYKVYFRGTFEEGFTGKMVNYDLLPPYSILIYDSEGNEYCAIGAWREDMIVIGRDQEVIPCGNQTGSGRMGTIKNFHYMGTRAGTISIHYNMYNVGDRIDVFYRGNLVASTRNFPRTRTMDYFDVDNITNDPYINYQKKIKRSNGFVSGTGSLSFYYNATSNIVEVVVCGGGTNDSTLWEYTITCP